MKHPASIVCALLCAMSLAGCSDLLSTSTSGIRLFPEQPIVTYEEGGPAPASLEGSHWVVDENGERRWSENGSYARGLRKIDGSLYLFDNSGAMLMGWQQLEDAWYYFAPNANPPGAAASGWLQQGGAWYHFDDDCVMDTGWTLITGSWYHFSSDGVMDDGWLSIDGAKYHLVEGQLTRGWYVENQESYYLDPTTGAATVGWRFINGNWYYFDAEGKMLRAVWQDDYYLLYTGAMAFDWQRINGRWYYFDSNGTMLHDRWVDNYYLGSDGAMLTNQRTPDGYRVGPDGAWVTTGDGSNLGDPATQRVVVETGSGARSTTATESSSLRTVYFAPGSTVYHYLESCRDLYGARTVAQTTLAHALANNMTACTVCVN